MFLAPVSPECRFHLLHRASANVGIAQLHQRLRLSLPAQDRIENPQPCFPVEVADRVMEVDIHVTEGLLHVLHLLSASLAQIVTMPHEAVQTADVIAWTER